jgi:hypothetical protein
MKRPIGEVLNQWKSYLTNISNNLMELSQQIEFQQIKLKTKDVTNGYIGITKARAEQCLENFDRLWRYYSLLAEVVDKAENLYSKNSLFNNTEDDAREILERTLLVIESQRIAINERNLLSSENRDKKATSAEVLKYMQDSFDELCRNITEISKTSETLELRLKNIKKEISKLNSTSKMLGLVDIPDFDISKVNDIERDPLQGSAELDKLVYSIEKHRASIRTIEEEYRKIVETFGKVKNMLSELRDLSDKSKEAITRSQKIFGATQELKYGIDMVVIESLQDWLKILQNKLSEGNLAAVKVGLSKLVQECSEKLENERENYNIINKAYNEWLDLKGHFKALCAKADILKVKGLLSNNTLDEIIESTKAVLYSNQINLDNCRAMIRKIELSLKN